MSKFRNIKIRFEFGQEDRESDEMGPFPFAQLTYDDIRVGEDGDRFIATFTDGFWVTEDGQKWSDVVIFGVNDPIVDPNSPADWKQTVVKAGAGAIAFHAAQTRLEEDLTPASQLWHLLLSLKHWSDANGVDFDASLADMRREHKAGVV